jgi:hypothetical protein
MAKSTKNVLQLLLLPSAISGLTGCASISSELVCNSGNANTGIPACSTQVSVDDGIVYYMPKRPIRLTVAVSSPKSDLGAAGDGTQSGQAGKQPAAAAKPKAAIAKFAEVGTAAEPDSAPDAATKPKNITVTLVDNFAKETYPDPEQVFVLRYNKNYIGDNNMAVGVNSFGLLTVTHADTVNKINDIAVNVGAAMASLSLGAGSLPDSSKAPDKHDPLPTLGKDAFSNPAVLGLLDNSSVAFSNIASTCQDSTYTVVIDPKTYKKPTTVCGVTIKLDKEFERKNAEKQNGSSRINPVDCHTEKVIHWMACWVKFKHGLRVGRNIFDVVHTQNTLESVPGLFYKQDLPYYVTIKRDDAGEGEEAKFIAMSPNESKIYFAPITETVFTDNTSDITVVNGVVNSLKENTDSELLALSKIPANVLGGYTSAIGNIFSGVKTSLADQASAGTSQLQVLSNAQMISRCQMAIAINNPSAKTGDAVALATAFSNIQSACASPGK